MWHWTFLYLSPQKWKCQKSPHLYEFYVHKQIIFEGQSSYRFLEWTFIKISNSFSEAVNNGEGGYFGFLPLLLSGNLQCIPIYLNSLTLAGSVPSPPFFFCSWKCLAMSPSCITASEKWQGVLRERGSQEIWYTQWWWSNVNEEDIKPNNSLSIGLVIPGVLKPVSHQWLILVLRQARAVTGVLPCCSNI